MWDLGDSRLIIGSARYFSPAILAQAVERSRVGIVTVSLRRETHGDGFWKILKDLPIKVLPNTNGCYTAREAVTVAEMAREIFNTNWIKVEVLGDSYTLQPNPIELIEACKELIQRGFEVFPYMTDDLVIAQKLVDAGCRILMPWASPIGTGRGIMNPYALQTLRMRFPDTTLIVDAGLGKPSQACQVMEMGFDGVLLNTAIAIAQDPPAMAEAFSEAVKSGRRAYLAGMMEARDMAEPSTPVLGTPFWHMAK